MEMLLNVRYYLSTAMSYLQPLVLVYFSMLAAYWFAGLFLPQAIQRAFQLDDMKAGLENIRRAHELPALGAALVTVDGVQSLATTGIRKKGSQVQVTDDDRWHIGSCGKAMTATMMARLVERGSLRWNQSLAESFPDLADQMDEKTKNITLIQLLSHRSGLAANFDLVKYVDAPDLIKARRQVVEDAIQKPLTSPPGQAHLYSNWGYTVAASMAEQATGVSWEELMKSEIFEPLEMSTAGFGGTGTIGQVDQPWPHYSNGRAVPTNGPKMDNVPTMGPAGTMHMTLGDWSKFIIEHLRGVQGKGKLLSQASYEHLQTEVGDHYGLGWVVAERDWGGGKVLNHAGDNTMNFALVWAAPKKGFAVLVVTNKSGAMAATDLVAASIIKAVPSR